MTTLVQTRQPLQVLSMSNQPKRRRSSRLAGRIPLRSPCYEDSPDRQQQADGDVTAYDEQDGDFHFTRGSKRIKTQQQETIPEDDPPPEPVLAPAPAPAPKRGRPRTNKNREPQPLPPSPPQLQPATRRNAKRRSSQITADQDEASAPPPPSSPPPQRSTRRRGRPSLENKEKEPAKVTNGVAKKPRAREVVQEETPPQSTPVDESKARGSGDSSEPKKIALPFSDTPVMNRNKEMRRKTGARRSSLGMRGRRASSLIDSGHNAIPHRAVDSAEFYKHIEAELIEPRRMKQLLTWCGERALSEKPPLGSLNSNAILGARAIQDQLLKDFASKSEFSNWFAREDVPKPPAIVKPNPRNIEHEEKIAALEERIKRLKAEKKTWQSLRQPPAELPPLFAPSEATSPLLLVQQLPQPDASLLDPDEAEMLAALASATITDTTPPTTGHAKPAAATATATTTTQKAVRAQLQALRASLGPRVDQLADGVHRLEARVAAGARQADRVLGLSAARLREREARERARAGTRDMPVMEVLRSLGRILPPEAGEGG
ncbi:Mis12-Mtw1 protein family-domain-containing protein [Durotheca rogersii]|uniref:Mis12-Mtw1 protein family-domain-containing protein n=1 Tax=Durotheca rogersii TaxID=419775 RepID=UPI00221E9702|nr:Mis12-Mtw1 protein family-domain-containing protein [Durotheca rogersii]KAI5859752.1 Mis12-Mtw1 protein family-domain-containing protein [Durotheca rogersii]